MFAALTLLHTSSHTHTLSLYYHQPTWQEAAERRAERDAERRSFAAAVSSGVPAQDVTMQHQTDSYPGISHTSAGDIDTTVAARGRRVSSEERPQVAAAVAPTTAIGANQEAAVNARLAGSSSSAAAAGVSSESDQHRAAMAAPEVEESPVDVGAPAAAPAGPAVLSSPSTSESPRKRSFFGSLKKALAPSSGGGGSSNA